MTPRETNQGAVRIPAPSTVERRARLRLGGSWLVTLGVLGACGYGLWWAAQPQVTPIRDVEVHGEFRYLDGRDIEIAIKPFLADGFFGLHMATLKHALEAIPWVEEADLRRVWPGRLRVNLRERTALAQWQGGGYVSTNGVRFTPTEGPKGLVMLGGPADSAAEAADTYRELAPVIADAGLDLRALETDARRAWNLRVVRERDGVGEDIELKLGSDALRTRLQRFVTVYTQRLAADARPLANVDLRYTNGLAVRFSDDAHPQERIKG